MKKRTWYLVLISIFIIGVGFAAQQTVVSTDTLQQGFGKSDANDTELYGIAATTVVGPAVALDNEILVSDGTTGKLLKKSGATIDANGLALPAVPIPIDNYISSDNNDADQTSATTRCVVTTGTAASVVSDYYIAVKDGGDASGVETDVIHVDGSGSLINMLWNTVLQANDIIASELADWYAYDTIPIAWANGGTSEPDAIDSTTRTPYAYRTFDSAADEDLNLVWFVPSDLSGTTIQYRVKYLVTNATGPTAEGVAFGLSGISNGDNDITNGTKGTVVVITDPTITAVQHDVLITGWSGDVTVTGLLAGEVAELAIIRDVSDAADTYLQVVGVFAIEIRYVRNVAR